MNKGSTGWSHGNRTEQENEFHSALEHQRDRDLAIRQKPGIIFYPVVWLMVTLAILSYQPSNAKAAWLIGIGTFIILSSLYRLYSTRRFAAKLQSGQPVSLWLLTHAIIINAASWGLFLVLALLPTPLSEHYSLIFTGTLALAAGGANSLSIKTRLVYWLMFSLLGPAIIVSLSGYSLMPAPLGLLLLVFAGGMTWVSSLPRKEYEKAVISNLKLSHQANYLTELTTLDGLTGVKNRRFFDQLLSSEIRRANRLEYPLALLMIDIDHFKRINDEFGHIVGDSCLINTAKTLQNHIQRSSDVVARYGGEEFAVILPGVETEDAIALAETLRVEVESTITWNLTQPIRVTISIGGVSLLPVKSTQPQDYLAMADKALYEAKKQGRNCIYWSHGDGSIKRVSEKGDD
ncbi:GGDEF domain-containing protein [Hahella ganghwensis]|uniref:GGDEF domain-containing protein n=1 Tax=Hahella ganghwensis TaxID=286420 RepID=UPI000380BCF4|nr:sensor domain-containing diguanylate cyclase [Hahella ganghwensis]